MSITVVLFLLLFYLGNLNGQTDYCQLSCGENKNTVCARKSVNCNAGVKCGAEFKVIKFSDDQKNHYVEVHNNYRSKIATGQETRGSNGKQPSASNMNALTHDSDLEFVAQCWTNNCVFKHDSCRKTEKYSSVGQNLALYKTTAPTNLVNITARVELMIRNWYNEVQYYSATPTFQSAYNNQKVIGHYTQLVWATTKQVGCAMTYFKQDKWNVYFFACNYGPAGNIINTPVYKTGLPASECPGGRISREYLGLCQT